MEKISTTKCAQHGHPEFCLEFEQGKTLEADVRWFAESLEKMVAGGEKFTHGQSMQLGWTYVLIEKNADGTLSFSEPEMTKFPIEWQPGISNALRQLRLHKDVVESVLPMDSLSIPSLRQSCIVCTNLKDTDGFMMDRQETDENDSGWFIGCNDPRHAHDDIGNLARASLYEAMVLHAPQALPFLALPVSTSISLDDRKLLLWQGETALKFKPGSYLDLYTQNRQT